MEKPYADLHVHSYYSDSSMSPEEIVRAAGAGGVGILAIADHDILAGNLASRDICKAYSIRYIPAVEIDTLYKGENYHILAYGFDAGNTAFTEYINHTRFLLDEVSVKLVELMSADYSGISLKDYFEYEYDRRLGGWKALQYFMDKGLTSFLKEGIGFYNKYGVTYDKSGYSTITAAAYRIKSAGGYAVLAHPGELILSSDKEEIKDELRRIVLFGMDGIECYYPTHSDVMTGACVEVCEENSLLITSGSDCHGTFGKTSVGEMKMPVGKLRLGKLLYEEY